jgi:hypothetical protein
MKPPWHHLISFGEWKSGKTFTEDELTQTGAYAGSLNQAGARPRLAGSFFLPAGVATLLIYRTDPATWTMSNSIQWNNLDSLIGESSRTSTRSIR